MIKQLCEIWMKNPKNKKIMVLTGPGISLSSGISKNDNNLFLNEKINSQLLLSNPFEIWNFVKEKRKVIAQKTFNISHASLVQLEKTFKHNFYLVTENIDNLHSLAGNFGLIELYGNIFKDKPMKQTEMGFLNIDWSLMPVNSLGNFIRPDILLNGENILKKTYLQAHLLAQQCDICLIIGSDLSNDMFSELPIIAKKFNNATVIEINPEASFFEDVDIYIKSDAEKILPMIIYLMIELEVNMKNTSSN